MKKIGKNIWYLFLNTLANFIIGAIFWISLIGFIEASDYGTISYIYSSSIFLSNVFSFGIFSAVWKYCSENKLKKIILISFISLSLSLILIYITSTFLLQNKLIFIFSVLLYISSYLENILYGYSETDKIFISNFFSLSIKVLALFFIYLASYLEVKSILYIVFASISLSVILKIFFTYKRIIQNLDFSIRRDDLKRFFSFSLSSFLSIFSNSFLSQFLVIFSFISLSPIISAIIYFSQIISSIISFIPSTIVNASLPIISGLSKIKKYEKVKEIIKNIYTTVLIAMIPLTFLISFHLENFLIFLNAKIEFSKYSSSILLIVSTSSMFFILSNFIFSFLFSTGILKPIFIIETFSVILFVLFIYFFSNLESFGFFLIFYLFLSVFRFFAYAALINKNIENVFSKLKLFSLKISVFIVLSIIISGVLTSKDFLIDIIFLSVSILAILLLIKTLRFVDEELKRFIIKLSLPKIIEKVILALL